MQSPHTQHNSHVSQLDVVHDPVSDRLIYLLVLGDALHKVRHGLQCSTSMINASTPKLARTSAGRLRPSTLMLAATVPSPCN
jgi:hypothetical protein